MGWHVPAGTDSYQQILAEAAIEAGEVPQGPGAQGPPQLNLAVSPRHIRSSLALHQLTPAVEQPCKSVGLGRCTAEGSRWTLGCRNQWQWLKRDLFCLQVLQALLRSGGMERQQETEDSQDRLRVLQLQALLATLQVWLALILS